MIKYYPCELHCHTIHSDGDFLPQELQKSAVNDGLSLIALTDHNTTSGWEELSSEIIPFIRGIEWTTYFGHMLVLGAEKFVDWRNAVPDNIDEKIAEVKNAGGIVGIAHPFQLGSPFCTGGRWEFNVTNWDNVNYIEIWHECFPNCSENEPAFKMWTDLLDKGYKIAPSYGRDWHRPNNPTAHLGHTLLGIDGEISEKTALDAIKKGRTAVTTGAFLTFYAEKDGSIYEIGDTMPDGEITLNITADVKFRFQYYGENTLEFDEIRIISNGNKTISSLPCKNQKITISTKQNRWYRAELWGKLNGKNAVLAVTGAVYCK